MAAYQIVPGFRKAFCKIELILTHFRTVNTLKPSIETNRLALDFSILLFPLQIIYAS